MTAEQAISNGASGPNLRASGVPYDIRRADPYSIYDRLDFDVVVHYHGDVFDRYLIRLDEVRQANRILQQVVRDIPEGPIMTGKPAYQVRVPAGESYGRVEAPKGEFGFYIVSTGKPNPVAVSRSVAKLHQPDEPGRYVPRRQDRGRCTQFRRR